MAPDFMALGPPATDDTNTMRGDEDFNKSGCASCTGEAQLTIAGASRLYYSLCGRHHFVTQL